MKNSVKTLVMISALTVGIGVNSAFGAPAKTTAPAVPTSAEKTVSAPVANPGIAIVDVSKVVASSSQVANLKKEQEAKAKELLTFVEKARKDVAAVTDTKKKQALEEKYTKELTAKKAAMDKNYAEKLAKIDTDISKQIENIAKAEGFSMVVAKGIVLFGGTDITDKVIKAVK